MTNKQKVKNVFPSAYSLKRQGGMCEIWLDADGYAWFQSFFDGSIRQLYFLTEGKTWQSAWSNAWSEVQRKMIKKLES